MGVIHLFAARIHATSLGDLDATHVKERARLSWVKPERVGGASLVEYQAALDAHPQPPREDVVVGTLDDLDPT